MSVDKIYFKDEVEVILKDKNGNVKAVRKSSSEDEVLKTVLRIIRYSTR